MIRHWCHRKDAFDGVMDAFVANFMRPGNLAGGFGWYRALAPGRLAVMRGEAVLPPRIEVPTCVRWGEHDPVLPYRFAENLDQIFANLDFTMFEGVGHFPHMEDPDRAAAEIGRFFDSLEA
jgi:pimeloyl-ACP methyl ester carboxylesterase